MPPRVCRGCLTTGPRLYSIHQSNLYEMFLEVIGMPKSKPDDLPQKICGMCYAELRKCVSFRSRCRLAQAVLDELKLKKKLTTRFITQIERRKLDSITNLTTVTPSSCDLLIQEEFADEPLLNPASDGDTIGHLYSSVVKPKQSPQASQDDNTEDCSQHTNNFSESIKRKEADNEHVEMTSGEDFTKLKNQIYDDLQSIEKFKQIFKMGVEFLTTQQEIDEIKALIRQSSTEVAAESYFHISEDVQKYMKEGNDESTGPYECKICRRRFSTQQSQRHHYRTHKTRISCEQCEFTTNSFGVAMNHARGHGINVDSLRYRCKYCESVFEKSDSLNSHLSAAHTNKLHWCRFCGETALNEKGMTFHMKCHEDILKTEYKCRTCNLKLISSSALENYLSLSCKCFNCEMCGDNFESKSILKNHIREEHASSKYIRLAECDGCNVKFIGKAPLEKHITEELCGCGIPCATCGRSFETSQTLEDHRLEFHANHYRACESCDKAFDSKNYRQHIARVHKTKAASERRGKQPHTSAKVWPVQDNEIRDVPVEDHTEPANDEEPEGIHICEVCGIALTIRENITRHMRAHADEILYRCDIRSKKHARKESLDTHTDVRRRNCHQVDKHEDTQEYVDSESNTQGYVNSESNNQCYVNSESSTQGYVNSESSTQGYANSESSTQGYVNTEVSTQGYVNTESSTQGYVITEVSTQGYVNTEVSTQGYVNTEVSTQGYVNTEVSTQSYVHTESNTQGYVDSELNTQEYVDSESNNQSYVYSETNKPSSMDSGIQTQNHIGSERSNRVVKVIPLNTFRKQKKQAKNTNIQTQDLANNDLMVYNKTSGRIIKTIHMNRRRNRTNGNITAQHSIESTAHTQDFQDPSFENITQIQDCSDIQNQGNVEYHLAEQSYISTSEVTQNYVVNDENTYYIHNQNHSNVEYYLVDQNNMKSSGLTQNEIRQNYVINDGNTYIVQNDNIYTENGIQILVNPEQEHNIVVGTLPFNNQLQIVPQEQNIHSDGAQVYMIPQHMDLDVQDNLTTVNDSNDISMAVVPRIAKTININRKKKRILNNIPNKNLTDTSNTNNRIVSEQNVVSSNNNVYKDNPAPQFIINDGQVYYLQGFI